MRKTLALVAVLAAATLAGGCVVAPAGSYRPIVRTEPIVIIDVAPVRVYVPPVIFLPLPYYYHERHHVPPPRWHHRHRRHGH